MEQHTSVYLSLSFKGSYELKDSTQQRISLVKWILISGHTIFSWRDRVLNRYVRLSCHWYGIRATGWWPVNQFIHEVVYRVMCWMLNRIVQANYSWANLLQYLSQGVVSKQVLHQIRLFSDWCETESHIYTLNPALNHTEKVVMAMGALRRARTTMQKYLTWTEGLRSLKCIPNILLGGLWWQLHIHGLWRWIPHSMCM